jgi:hypothetical protein
MHRALSFQEFSRFFDKRLLSLFAVVLIICLYLCGQGIKQYNHHLQQAAQFQKAEKKIFDRLDYYAQYSIQGVRFLVIPSPLYIFFADSGAYKDLTARINPVVSIDIYSNRKGKDTGDDYQRLSLDFASFIYLFGSILSLLSGYLRMNNRRYLMFLSNFTRPAKMFLAMIFYRFLFIVLTLIFIFAAVLVLVYAAGIGLSARDYYVLAAFAGAAILMMLSYFMAGIMTGLFLEKWNGASALLITWIVFSFIIPGAVQSIIHKKDNNTTGNYKIESKKIDMVTGFEKESSKKEGDFDRKRLEVFKNLAEYYWKEIYPEIEAVERNYHDDIETGNRKKMTAMQYTPATFYHLTAREASSMGLMNASAFHAHLIVKQKEFARFYIDRCFYHDPKEMVSFIKGDENLFKAEGNLPPGYPAGIIIQSCLCFILLLASLARFKKQVPPHKDKNLTGKTRQDLAPKQGKLKVLLLKKTNFSRKAYHYLGASRPGSWFFVYLCHPDHLPGFIKVKTFIKFMLLLMGVPKDMQRTILEKVNPDQFKGKLMKHLSPLEKGKILLTLLKGLENRRPLFLLNDIAEGYPFEFTIMIKDWIKEMKQAGAFVLFLTTLPVPKDERFQSDSDYEELPDWEKSIDLIKKAIDKKST